MLKTVRQNPWLEIQLWVSHKTQDGSCGLGEIFSGADMQKQFSDNELTLFETGFPVPSD